MRMCHFRDQNIPICPDQTFLVQSIIITFIYLLALFVGQISKKIITVDPELWGCAILGPEIVQLPQTIFFWRIINVTLFYLLALFIVQNIDD